jgi:hypothetical protein
MSGSFALCFTASSGFNDVVSGRDPSPVIVNASNGHWITSRGMRLLLVYEDPLDSSDSTIVQPHLDPARMISGGCQDILDNLDGSVAGSLVFFQDNLDPHTGSDGVALLSVQYALPSTSMNPRSKSTLIPLQFEHFAPSHSGVKCHPHHVCRLDIQLLINFLEDPC